jgi:hypothetical protein
MSKRSTDSDKGHYVPGNPLEKLYEEMKSGLLASGRTVTERAVSDTEPYEARFPRGRRSKAPPQGE